MDWVVTPMDWVKIACNLLDHRKIKIIRSGPEGDTICLLWELMIIEAGKCNRGGYLMISDNRPYSEETVSTLTGIALPTVRLGLAAFADLGMINRNDGAIFIKNWRKYQSEDKLEARREKERIRQQRHRAKEREKIEALPAPDPVSRDSETLPSRDVTLENRQDKCGPFHHELTIASEHFILRSFQYSLRSVYIYEVKIDFNEVWSGNLNLLMFKNIFYLSLDEGRKSCKMELKRIRFNRKCSGFY